MVIFFFSSYLISCYIYFQYGNNFLNISYERYLIIYFIFRDISYCLYIFYIHYPLSTLIYIRNLIENFEKTTIVDRILSENLS